MALPNNPLGELKAVKDPEVEEREVDVLIVGGGMAACGSAFEVKKWMTDDQSVLLVDKAALERSGAVAQGLSAINTYIGENAPEDYVRMVRNDLMGIVREDLIFSKLDDFTYIFEGKTALKDFYRVAKIENEEVFEAQKGESETIAGFVLEIAGSFPKRGEVVTFKDYQFLVESLDKKRLKQIKVTLPNES